MSRHHRPAARLLAFSTALLVAPATQLCADTAASATLAVRAEVHARTSLQVSARQLSFELAPDQSQATTALEFRAAARTGSGAEVVLTIESERWVAGPGGAADVDADVSFVGEGPGTVAGPLVPRATTVAGRWVGSGARAGRLVFTLHAGTPGAYHLPVRLVLSAP